MSEPSIILRQGEWRLKAKDGSDVALSKNRATILLALMLQPKVPTGQMVTAVWPDPDLEPDWAEESLKVTISTLNKLLKASGCKFSIRVLRNRGCYVLA